MLEVEPIGAQVVGLPPRAPGRPPGQKKSGGRRPGSKNKRTVAGEVALQPLLPNAKRRIKALINGDDDELAYRCAIKVFEYCYGKPRERKEVSGPDGEPIETVALTGLDDREHARRILSLIDRATRDEPEDAPPRPAAGEPQDASDAAVAPATCDGEEAAPVPPESGDRAQQAPPEGKSLWIGGVELRNLGPDRPNLPPVFGVFEDGLQLRRGNFETCLELTKKRVGEPLPPGRVTATGSGEPVAWPAADQRPSPAALPKVYHRRRDLPAGEG